MSFSSIAQATKLISLRLQRRVPRAYSLQVDKAASMQSLTNASVGLVTTIGCPYCKKAKDALSKANVEYVVADLTGNPLEALTQVKASTGQRTVPQVFVGGEFVGGASELLAIMASGELTEKLKLVQGSRPFPQDLEDVISKAMALQEESLALKALPEPAADEISALRADLEQTLVRKTRTIGGREFLCATGADLAQYLDSRKLSITETMTQLLKLHVISPVVPPEGPSLTDSEFTPTDTALYQLLSDAPPPRSGDPMNTHYQWYGAARPAVEVSADLRGRILDLYDAHLSPDGRAVDYAGIATDPRFTAYVNASAELQRVDLTPLSREERIAFFINVYNALIVHATVVFGSPDALLKRLKFFANAIYFIGGAPYSADDVEHGMLRNNAASPASIGSLLGLPFLKPPQIPAGDARLKQRVDPMDPRIHFALVCGAKSCPPIKLYTPDNLEEGLQDAASAFCESEISVDSAKGTATLSKIFKWYGKDFGAKEPERLAAFAAFCDVEKREQLLALVSSGKFHVKYKEYDWSPNSK